MTQATEGGVKEIALSKLALEKSKNGAIRDFAQKMVDDHTEAGQKLSGLVERQSLGGPTEQQAAKKAAAAGAKLNRLSGDAFDRDYASTMVADHVLTIDLFQNEARHGSDAALKEFADQTLPKLKQHLEMAKKLEPASSSHAYAAGSVSTPVAAAKKSMTRASDSQRSDAAQDASAHISKALETVRQMQKDPEVKSRLAHSLGVFVIPDYGRAALGVGAQGGAGVLMVKRDGTWSGPGFYNFGGVSVGAQAGVSAGQIVMMLMDRKAVTSFARDNKFSLNSDAGLTIVNYSARAHGEAGRGDVVVWSDTEGAFANLSLSITDVNFDEKETAALYGKSVSAKDIVNAGLSSPKASALAAALPK